MSEINFLLYPEEFLSSSIPTEKCSFMDGFLCEHVGATKS